MELGIRCHSPVFPVRYAVDIDSANGVRLGVSYLCMGSVFTLHGSQMAQI